MTHQRGNRAAADDMVCGGQAIHQHHDQHDIQRRKEDQRRQRALCQAAFCFLWLVVCWYLHDLYGSKTPDAPPGRVPGSKPHSSSAAKATTMPSPTTTGFTSNPDTARARPAASTSGQILCAGTGI